MKHAMKWQASEVYILSSFNETKKLYRQVLFVIFAT